MYECVRECASYKNCVCIHYFPWLWRESNTQTYKSPLSTHFLLHHSCMHCSIGWWIPIIPLHLHLPTLVTNIPMWSPWRWPRSQDSNKTLSARHPLLQFPHANPGRGKHREDSTHTLALWSWNTGTRACAHRRLPCHRILSTHHSTWTTTSSGLGCQLHVIIN